MKNKFGNTEKRGLIRRNENENFFIVFFSPLFAGSFAD
jgi:hypothetical protein